MPDNKMKNQYSENSERQRMAAIKEMEKYPSPMTKAFLRPAYDRTEICPDFSRRPSNQNHTFRGGMNVDRLTIPDEPIDGGMRRAVVNCRAVKERAMTIYWRLKAYEDSGLMPEGVKAVKEKRIPCVPKVKTERFIEDYNCPCCGHRFISKDETGWFAVMRTGYCPDCGQAIDWES